MELQKKIFFFIENTSIIHFSKPSIEEKTSKGDKWRANIDSSSHPVDTTWYNPFQQ